MLVRFGHFGLPSSAAIPEGECLLAIDGLRTGAGAARRYLP